MFLSVFKAFFRPIERALAADTPVGLPIPTGTRATGGSYSNFESYVSDIYSFAQYVGVALAIMMIVYAGILYTTSAGDSNKLNTAKEIAIGALIGLAMLFMLNFLARLLGVSTLKQ